MSFRALTKWEPEKLASSRTYKVLKLLTCEMMILSNHLFIYNLPICCLHSTQVSLDSVSNHMVFILPPHLYSYQNVILFPTKSSLTNKAQFSPTSSINLTWTTSDLQIFLVCGKIWTTQNLAHCRFICKKEIIMHTSQDFSRRACERAQHTAGHKVDPHQCW